MNADRTTPRDPTPYLTQHLAMAACVAMYVAICCVVAGCSSADPTRAEVARRLDATPVPITLPPAPIEVTVEPEPAPIETTADPIPDPIPDPEPTPIEVAADPAPEPEPKPTTSPQGPGPAPVAAHVPLGPASETPETLPADPGFQRAQEPEPSPQLPRVTLWSADGCTPCQLWKANERDYFQSQCVQVTIHDTAETPLPDEPLLQGSNARSLPRFVITAANGRRAFVVGYLTFDRYLDAVNRLRN